MGNDCVTELRGEGDIEDVWIRILVDLFPVDSLNKSLSTDYPVNHITIKNSQKGKKSL